MGASKDVSIADLTHQLFHFRGSSDALCRVQVCWGGVAGSLSVPCSGIHGIETATNLNN